MNTSADPIPVEWREGRRLRAWDLAQQGWKQKDIAAALGVSQGAVSQWLSRARADGPATLRRKPPPGRRPRLTDEQRAQIPELLARGAEAWRFRGNVWTRNRIALVIKEVFISPMRHGINVRSAFWNNAAPIR